MSDFTVKHKFQLRMIIIPFHIRNVLSSPTETKLPPSSGRTAMLMKENTKQVKYNHVKIGKGFIREHFGRGAPAGGETTSFFQAYGVIACVQTITKL